MKKTFRKSTVLFMALAVFAMIFTGCKKDKSTSDNNGGGGGGDNPPVVGNYGTVTCGDDSFDIVAGGWTVEEDEDFGQYVAVALVDRIDGDERTKAAIIGIPFYDTMPTGTFSINEEPDEEGESQLVLTLTSDDFVFGKRGSVTITKTGNNYKIDGNAVVVTYPSMDEKACKIIFEGPLVTEAVAKLK